MKQNLRYFLLITFTMMYAAVGQGQARPAKVFCENLKQVSAYYDLDPTDLGKAFVNRYRPFILLSQTGGFMTTDELMSYILGATTQVKLMYDSAELRYLPFMQVQQDIMLITQSLGPLNLNRINKVIHVAKDLNIKLHVLYFGEANEQAAQLFSRLSQETGGVYLDYLGQAYPCQTN